MVKDLLGRLKQYEAFFTPKGTADLIGTIDTYRRTYGEKWLDEFKGQMPDLCLLVDLAANHEFPAAWAKLLEMVDEWIDAEESLGKRIALHAGKGMVIEGARPDIERLHAAIRAEIDRPRGF